MLAYKFRAPNQLHFALDILFNRRLYCSEWHDLNDPMEGAFVYSGRATDGYDYSREVERIIREKKRLLICSLSRTFDCHLLWAHYADGFRGLAIEVELPEDSNAIRSVQYGGVFAYLNSEALLNPEDAAEQILSSKYREWEYEREIRILQPRDNGNWYRLQSPIRRVIAGHRMDRAVLDGLRIICTSRNISLYQTGIGDEGIDADLIFNASQAQKLPTRDRKTRAKALQL